HDHGAVAVDIAGDRDWPAEESRTAIDQLTADGVEGRRAAGHHHGGDPRTIGVDGTPGERIVAQPEAMALLGPGRDPGGQSDRGREEQEEPARSAMQHEASADRRRPAGSPASEPLPSLASDQ